VDEDVRAALDELLATASEDEQVVAVLRFGSSLDDPHRARDVDVAVVFDRGTEVALDDELTYHRFSSGERNAGLDVSVFRQLPVYVRQRVLAEAEPVCVEDVDELYAIAIATVKEYERFRPFHRRYLEAVADA
jgi:predicted nucleotidyltransferase